MELTQKPQLKVNIPRSEYKPEWLPRSCKYNRCIPKLNLAFEKISVHQH